MHVLLDIVWVIVLTTVVVDTSTVSIHSVVKAGVVSDVNTEDGIITLLLTILGLIMVLLGDCGQSVDNPLSMSCM